MTLLVVDNDSVYFDNLIDFLKNQNIIHTVLQPSNIDPTCLDSYNSIILSGRRNYNRQNNLINSKLIKHAISSDVSLFGICYGAEILALTVGGTLRKCKSPRRGIYTVEIIKPNNLCNGTIHVLQSHSYEIGTLPSSIIPLAKSTDCSFEIIQYKDRPIFGTQFHPESTNDGHAILKSFLKMTL